ncbi:winged helix-turn-helix domain-containing protein [Streptomyces sp. NPDC007960]|uniref:winged helix-turn-helix domain-containing protein n=1 Tax=Streptomyces sp. NPDC007960 TaxID=3364798 RepID=UPI0036EB3244
MAASGRPDGVRRSASKPVKRCEERTGEGSLDVHVKRLRAKIEPDPGAPRHLVTVRGLGHKFEP